MAATQTQVATVAQTREYPVVHIAAQRGWLALDLAELWAYRELLYFFIWRDIKVRYKQTVIGAAWAVLQPVMTMLVFSLFFGKLAKIPSQGLPYPIFYYCALLPWMYFATAMQGATNIVVDQQRVITKIYFPRVVLPIASVLSGLLDFAISFAVLLAMMVYYRIVPTSAVIWLGLHAARDPDRSRRRPVAFRPERLVQGRTLRPALPGAVLDVCLTGCLPELSSAGEMALALRIEPDGGRHRRVSLGADRARPTARHADGGVICSGCPAGF